MASCTAHPLRHLALSCLALLLLGGSPVLRADDHDHGSHELARQALKVEFEQDDGRFLYKIRLLQSDGRMVKLKVDAVDGKVLETKRKEQRKDRDAHPRR